MFIFLYYEAGDQWPEFIKIPDRGNSKILNPQNANSSTSTSYLKSSTFLLSCQN